MQLYDVTRTTFAVREFTDDPLPDPVLFRILDNARFAPTRPTPRLNDKSPARVTQKGSRR
jgi:hypothetical protein